MENYKRRLVDGIIERESKIFGGIYIKGHKSCGKTTTAKQHCKTVYSLSSSKALNNVKAMYYADPSIIYKRNLPILFDEWQEFPELWDESRNFIDEESIKGGVFFTGSRILSDYERKEKIHHSGSGRIIDIVMEPMTLFESGESNCRIKLIDLFDPSYKIGYADCNLSIEELIYATCRGGWPSAVINSSNPGSLDISYSLVQNLIHNQSEQDEVDSKVLKRLDPMKMERILKAYALNVSTMAKNSTLIKEVRGSNQCEISDSTFYVYRDLLMRKFVIDEVPSWSPLIKSRVNMQSLPKKEFVDPSLAIAALGLNKDKLLNSLYDYGFLFENLCYRDLKAYSQFYGGNLCYYHDRNGLECDFVITLRDGRYALVEVKLGSDQFESAERNLLKLKSLIKKNNEEALAEGYRDRVMQLPSSLIILTGQKSGMTLKSGVHIVPIGCLGVDF